MRKPSSPLARFSLLAALPFIAAACGEEQMTEPTLGPDFAVGDGWVDANDVPAGIGTTCAFFPADEDPWMGEPLSLTATATAGDVISGAFDVMPPPDCVEIWNATGADAATLSVEVADLPTGLVVERVVVLASSGAVTTYEGATGASADVSDLLGASVWFKLKREDTPPSGGQGCTPGYWRQPHHYDSWEGYAPTDLFSDVFADAFPGETLGEVVRAKGGKINALGRHAVAALLNTSSSGVDYDYTTAQVISAFNDAFASGDRRTIEGQKDEFDFLNNQGCTLN